MFTNLRYSWLALKRGGWKAMLSVLIIYVFLYFFGLMLKTQVISHVFMVLYIVLYFDLNALRYTFPVELSNLLPFPESGRKKFTRLTIMEATGLKLLFVLIYVVLQVVFADIYKRPVLFLDLFLIFASYHFAYVPILQMMRRKTSFSIIFRIVVPLVIFLPVVMLRRVGYIKGRLMEFDHFAGAHLWELSAVLLLVTGLCYAGGALFYRWISHHYPFYDQNVVDKLNRRKW